MEGYTVWTHHGERVDPSGDASGLSSTLTTMNQEPRAPISSPTTAGPTCGNNDSARDYTVEDILGEMADGVADGEAATVQEPEDIEVIEGLVSHIDEDDVVYGSPKWLENFREMKQAALDPLYKDGGNCPKECTVLRFNLHMLMMKARHGFNELLNYLATTYPTGNKVPANTYRAKKLIRPVAMKLRKFDAYPNHCILYRGKEYENMTSCLHCGASRGMLDVVWTKTTMWPCGVVRRGRRGPRIAVPQPIASRLSRMRKKRVTRGGKVRHYRCGTCL